MAQGTSVVTITQLAGDKLTLRLADHAAPHGRPRQGPVATPELRLRESEVYYAGNSVPTRHIFGAKIEPITMHGRFRDSKGGSGFAKEMHDSMKILFGGWQQVRVNWDDMFDFVGVIVRYTPKIESQGEIEWELEIKVDKDNLEDVQSVAKVVGKIESPRETVNKILANLKLKDTLPLEPPTLKGDLVDQLNGLVSTVNSATAFLVDVSNDIDSFVTGTFTALARFRAGLGQARVAVANVRNTYDNLTVQIALENQNINESTAFWDLQAAWSSSSLEALRLMAAAEREAAKAEQGELLAMHTADIGETWESIASRWYGTADRAEDVRTANGVAAGLEPVPGTTYFVPR